MMMRIFGAALIVSGGYLIGWIRTYQWKKRLKGVLDIHVIFEGFNLELRSYRRSIDEYLQDKGEMGYLLLHNQPIKGLQQEDHLKIDTAMNALKSRSFTDSIKVMEDLLDYFTYTINKLQEDIASSGKALPLLTGAIGLLIAILLF